jgi:CDP-diacylglycerol--glycerol-3-phosphate 3-phosphatidyltransferase
VTDHHDTTTDPVPPHRTLRHPVRPVSEVGIVNWANTISVVRVLLIPVFIVLLLSSLPLGQWLAIGVFGVAAFTDRLDGYVARSRNQVTALGQFLDPLADKLLISAALIALVGMNALPAWVAMVIIAREFAVSALRIVAVDQGVSIPASRLGKAKTISQIVGIIIFMWPVWHGMWFAPYVENTAIVVMVTLTLVSGVQYFLNARDKLHMPGASR